MASLKEMGYGITLNGFNRPNNSVLLAQLESFLKETDSFGSDFSFDIDKVLFQLSTAQLTISGDLLEIVEDVFNNATPLKAEGVPLRRFGGFIGIDSKQISYSKGKIVFTGIAGTQIPAGYQCATDDLIVFTVDNGATIIGTEITLDVTCSIGGDIGNVEANSISKPITPLVGLTSFTNPSATSGGQDAETDTEWKDKYDSTLSETGGLNVDGIASKIKELAGVTSAIVLENDQAIEVGGLPPKSIAAYVLGGIDAEIAQVIFTSKAGGIESFGDVTVAVLDTQGFTHLISFSRPTAVNVWFNITLVKSVSYPIDGDTKIIDAVVAEINSFGLNKNVYPYNIINAIANLELSGIEDVSVQLSTDGIVYTSTPITIDVNEYAVTEVAKVAIL